MMYKIVLIVLGAMLGIIPDDPELWSGRVGQFVAS